MIRPRAWLDGSLRHALLIAVVHVDSVRMMGDVTVVFLDGGGGGSRRRLARLRMETRSMGPGHCGLVGRMRLAGVVRNVR